jgi:CheY-like chemotaxis protein
LVTDIKLGLDGWQLARRVREIDPNFPIVYMTEDSAEEWKSKRRARQYPVAETLCGRRNC